MVTVFLMIFLALDQVLCNSDVITCIREFVRKIKTCESQPFYRLELLLTHEMEKKETAYFLMLS